MIDAILSVSNPDEVSAKRIRKALQELFATNLETQRKKVNMLIIERFNKMQDDRLQISQAELLKRDAAQARDLQNRLKEGSKRARSESGKPKKVKKRTRQSDSSNNNSLAQRKLQLSPELQQFLGEKQLARTQVVKKVWDHIKEHDLQNPEDRREIICDDAMSQIFGPKVSMFAMNKVLSKHLIKVDDTPPNEKPSDLASSPGNES
ncbi:LAMI_0C05160g1_1 [Lachancea mirantina]|uniref:LAMI_0C05160g1_1 n=1 Tax=Lachancea mirantina TaxID=1230905 RepID=A0A1G4J2K9_9SACH|nr:LAMI_0C05160g1_1 [Lachancea mirantina]